MPAMTRENEKQDIEPEMGCRYTWQLKAGF
jgi:hypothetical protein